MPMPLGHRVPLKARITRRTHRVESGCLEWKTRGQAYPKLKIDGAYKAASHVVWEEANGPVPDGLVLRHRCDNSRCVELLHLELGTHKQNSEDMVLRGRSARGERQGRSKLVSQQVRSIRSSNLDRRTIAEIFGISRSMVDRIKARTTWKHI